MKEGSGKALFAVAVGLLMVTSVIGIVLVDYSGPEKSLRYNSYRFERQADGKLVAKINSKLVPFTYFPAELESIGLSNSTVSRIKATRMVYVTSDYYGNFSEAIGAAEFDFGKALNDHYGIFVVQGFFQNATSLPVITCENSTQFVPVVSFEEGNETGFFERNSCIVAVSGSAEGFVKLRDRLIYGLLGVMNGN